MTELDRSREGLDGPRTWVLVLNFRGRQHLKGCLESLSKQDEPRGGAKIVVIDNASDDDSLDIVRRRFPDVEIIANSTNLGFAAGNNVGIRKALEAGAEYVALLNMDTTVDPSWLRELVEVADQTPDAALLGARIHTEDGSLVEFDGSQFDPMTTAGGYANRPPVAESKRYRDAAYACGAAVLMRAEALARFGLLDESFFAYHEDVELSLRAWVSGYRVLNVANSIVYHAVGGAGQGTEFRDFMGARNVMLTLLKLYDRAAWDVSSSELVDFFLHPPPEHLRAALLPKRVRSLLSAAFEAPAALEHRRSVRRHQKLTYSDLLNREERIDSIFET